jgi:predicted dehydrogenase
MERREFLASAVSTGAGLLVFNGPLLGATSPNNKLNIALLGAHGRASQHYGGLKGENIVALVDINAKNMALAAKVFPEAKQYVDWRKCLDDAKKLGLDAVMICAPDHNHGHMSSWALNRDLHIYCEKPLGICVEEAHVCRTKWLAKKDKLATQVGTQRHAHSNFQRVQELVRDGAIGELREAWAWGSRQIRRPGYLSAEGQPPDWLNFDLWLGPSPFHPYNPAYFSGGPGANCLQWNPFWDFGTGQVGDMGSHTMDLAWCALDADVATTAAAEGDKPNPDTAPVALHASFTLPANTWRKEIDLHWYQGGMMPDGIVGYIDLKKIGHGAMFRGSKGLLICDFTSRVIVPHAPDSDLTYYKPRPKEQQIPPIKGFVEEWMRACKGDNKTTTCNFDYSGKMMETMFLGLAAHRAQARLEYDAKACKVTNNPAANEFLRRKYREGWPLDG